MIAPESQAWRGLGRLQPLLHCAMLRVYCDEYRFMAATRIIKKYPNRRLYDTEISSYITVEEVRQLILDGEQFEVRDAKTGEDLTRQVLLQIIAEQEQGGEPVLSTQLLSQIIRFYGDSLQGFMGSYLERSMQMFLDQQDQFRRQMGGALGVALSGALMMAWLNSILAETVRGLDVQALLEHGVRALEGLGADEQNLVASAYRGAIAMSFTMSGVVMCCAFLLVLTLPALALRKAHEGPAPGAPGAPARQAAE